VFDGVNLVIYFIGLIFRIVILVFYCWEEGAMEIELTSKFSHSASESGRR